MHVCSCRLAAAPHQLPRCSAGTLRYCGVTSFLLFIQPEGKALHRVCQHVSREVQDLEPPGLTLSSPRHLPGPFVPRLNCYLRSRSTCICFTRPISSAQSAPPHSPCLILKPALAALECRHYIPDDGPCFPLTRSGRTNKAAACSSLAPDGQYQVSPLVSRCALNRLFQRHLPESRQLIVHPDARRRRSSWSIRDSE